MEVKDFIIIQILLILTITVNGTALYGIGNGLLDKLLDFASLVHCATGFRMNQLRRPHTLNFAVIVKSSGLVLTQGAHNLLPRVSLLFLPCSSLFQHS